jgi:hypothetical protein
VVEVTDNTLKCRNNHKQIENDVNPLLLTDSYQKLFLCGLIWESSNY